MRIGGLDRFFQVNVNTLATIPLKGILVFSLSLTDVKCHKFIYRTIQLKQVKGFTFTNRRNIKSAPILTFVYRYRYQ
jgi:hypothetical protein